MSGEAVSARATLPLTTACNNRCVFCNRDGLPGANAAPDDLTAELARARALHDELTFTGAEPTLDARLPGAIAAARALGFTRVGIQSNARRLAYPAYTQTLVGAGLTDLATSVHGAEAAVHDYLTGVDGAFAQTLAGIAAARAEGLTVVVTSVVTRSSFRHLTALPPLLRARGVAAWMLCLPSVAGRAATGFDRVVPRIALAAPFVLRALEAARRVGLAAWTWGLPACAPLDAARDALPAPALAFAAACEGCAARATCPGVDPVYLDRFGGDELRPRDALEPAPRSDPTLAALRRMFTGPGPSAPPLPVAVPSPPARARASLPVIGRSVPAREEAAPGAPRRSGEALRELFPALFVPRKGE